MAEKKTPDVYCCGNAARKRRSGEQYIIECETCGRKVSADSGPAAVEAFKKALEADANRPPQDDEHVPQDAPQDEPAPPPAQEPSPTEPDERPDLGVTLVPVSRDNLPRFFADHMSQMTDIAAPSIARDRPALTRLIRNNIRHAMTREDEGFKRCWQTPEGQTSIVRSIEEALSLGAELGKMGSLVPFNGICEFIPAVEAYEFALTNGNNPPFRWIQIDMIHEHDIKEITRVNGEFTCTVKPGVPRGKLQAVAVYGYNNRLGKTIGEVYDVERLLDKARRHSQSYKYYLEDKRSFEEARTEGKLKSDGKGEYVEKTMHKRGGGTWTKKIYRDDITNPYEGPDQPEMLRKAAGKSFLGKFARVRNAESAIEETRGADDAERVADAAIDAAFESFGAKG